MADDLDTFDPVRGPAREPMDAAELAQADARASVVLDRRRRRPRYFYDRFLTARDLTRGQQYTLLRQADLAQLSGAGVVNGLVVSTNALGTQLHVSAGLGVARSGESVTVRDLATLLVSRLRVVSRRPGSESLVANPATQSPPSGLFLLTAFPVEHTRTPGLAFPDGNLRPKQADTEIVESTWFGLVPLPNVDAREVVGLGRSRLAREIFVGGFDLGSLSDGLGLAVLGMTRGRVQWIDPALATRWVGADAVLGFGLRKRKVRLAFQEQYARQLEDEVERRESSGLPAGMLAREAFLALPPVGPLPRGAVEVSTTEIRQSFFPREIYVEMAIVPEDEVPALLSEGLSRAPIDLNVDAEALEGVPVLIVIPVSRAGYDQQTPRMKGAYRGPKLALTGRPLVRVRPIDALAVLRAKNEVPVVTDPVPLDLEAWRKAVESAPQLWYIRRQQFSTTSAVIPRGSGNTSDSNIMALLGDAARDRLMVASETERLLRLLDDAAPEVVSEVDLMLGGQLNGTPDEDSVLVSAIIGELAYMARRPRLTDSTSTPARLHRTSTSRALAPAAASTTPAPPPSPAFLEHETSNQLALRTLELSDVHRVASRFAAQYVGTAFRDPALRAPRIRSVLATSAVVPELATWAESPGSAIELVLAVAATADVPRLREMVAGVKLRVADAAQPIPRSVERSGETDSLVALRTVGHPALLVELERHLTLPVLSDQALWTSWLLMQLLVTGYALSVKTDAETKDLLDALQHVNGGARPFKAPNGDMGKILAAEAHTKRDALFTAAAAVSPDLVRTAQKRLAKSGLAAGDASTRSVLTHRLLALASTTLSHVDLLANAPAAAFDTFIKAAEQATTDGSVEGMRKALRGFSSRSTRLRNTRRGN